MRVASLSRLSSSTTTRICSPYLSPFSPSRWLHSEPPPSNPPPPSSFNSSPSPASPHSNAPSLKQSDGVQGVQQLPQSQQGIQIQPPRPSFDYSSVTYRPVVENDKPTKNISPIKPAPLIPKINRNHELYHSEIKQILESGGIEAVIQNKFQERFKNLTSDTIDSFGIFSNSEVRLNEISAFGFDYDYTLAQYTPHIQTEIYHLAMEFLIHNCHYPPLLRDACKYDPNFAIRGLHYDMQKGYLMKLDYLYNIQLGAIYFGRRHVLKEEALEVYGSLQLRENYANDNLRVMSDIFCLPETCLISDVIDFFTRNNFPFDPHIIYDDVTSAVNMIHRNGSLHRKIIHNIHRYLEINPDLGALLGKLKQSGKKTFMLTNSPYNFADAGMQYMLSDYLPAGIKHWTELFDVIITLCDKPNFFGRGRSFRILDPESSRLYWHKIDTFKPGQIYTGGNLADFTRISKWKGSQVLYFGDHLFSDLMEPSIREGWRTGVIIKELEREVETQNSPGYRKALSELLATEELIYKGQFYRGPDREEVLKLLKNRRFALRQALKEPFNKHFGSVFRTHNNATIFAHGLQQYADLYTSKIENFLSCPLDFSFYPVRNYLPHEFKLN